MASARRNAARSLGVKAALPGLSTSEAASSSLTWSGSSRAALQVLQPFRVAIRRRTSQTRVDQPRAGMIRVVEAQIFLEQVGIVGESAGHVTRRPVFGSSPVVQAPKIGGSDETSGNSTRDMTFPPWLV